MNVSKKWQLLQSHSGNEVLHEQAKSCPASPELNFMIKQVAQ